MIAGTFVRALPAWVLWLALAALVAAAAGWGYLRGLHSERAERDNIVADFAEFRGQVAAIGKAKATAAAADAGPDRPEPAAEDPTLAERCARTTLQCAYLQDWAGRGSGGVGD